MLSNKHLFLNIRSKVPRDIMIVICILKYVMYIIDEEYLVNNILMPDLGVISHLI